MGRYVPPELEGIASFNQASGTRARNLTSSGGLTVRFELPFAIWCTSCPKETIIGQGVRFNAEKKKIGNYFSTPIYSFRFKHTACGGFIEINTDPKNTAYVVVAGAKKRDTGDDQLKEGEVVIGAKSEEDRRRLEGDAFARLEDKVKDTVVAQQEKTRIHELYSQNSKDWSDPGEANRRLRKAFRVERKARHEKAAATEALAERLGFGGEILDESESDKIRAEFVDFGPSTDEVDAASQPLFSRSASSKKGSSTSGRTIERKKEALSASLRSTMRTAIDPFLREDNRNMSSESSHPRAVLKRKRDQDTIEATKGTSAIEADTFVPSKPPLVDYDSD